MRSTDNCRIIDFDGIFPVERSIMIKEHACSGVLIPFSSGSCHSVTGAIPSEDSALGALSRRVEEALRKVTDADFVQDGPFYDAVYAMVGLGEALSDLGLSDIKIPPNAAKIIGINATYRLPNKAWYSLRSLGESEHELVVSSMARLMHFGRVGRLLDKYMLMGLGHLLLPWELIGEEAFAREARCLVRMFPCLGLDRGMDRPSDYKVMFAYEGDGAENSPEFVPLLECYRKARSAFIQEYGIVSEDVLAGYIQAYGERSFHLDEKASAALKDAEVAHAIARQVLRSGGPDAETDS